MPERVVFLTEDGGVLFLYRLFSHIRFLSKYPGRLLSAVFLQVSKMAVCMYTHTEPTVFSQLFGKV